MNFELLKIGFKQYLEEINESSNKGYEINNAEMSIFMYADEFKEYIEDKLNLDFSSCNEDINDILKMKIVNGQLVDPEKEEEKLDEEEALEENNTEEATETSLEEIEPVITQEESENTANQSNINLEDPELITNMLNDLLLDKTFVDSLDTDGNGKIKEEELTNFFNTIKNYDSNENTISLEDIITAAQDIKDGNFKITTTETVKESVEAEVPITSGGGSTGVSSSGGGGSRGTSSSSGTSVSNNTTQQKSLENMTKEELNSELSTAESELTGKQDILSSILDGSEANIQRMTEEMEALYDTYIEELAKVDEDMAEQVDTLKQSIDDKQAEVDAKDQEIADQESTVSESENAYNNAVSTREGLESSLSALESVDTSKMDDTKKADLSTKIATLKSEISKAKEAEKKAKEAWDDAQEKLDSLNKERDELQTELDDLNADMTELEAEIAEKYPQVKEYMDSYNEAKETRDTYKAEATNAIKSEIATAQDYVNEVNTAITNYENKEKSKDFVLDGLTDATRNAIELAYSQLGVYEDAGDNRGTMEKYGGRAGDPWCASFVSWLYGKGQEGTETPLKYNAGVSGLRDQAREAGYYSEVGTYTPVPGDVMIQKSNGASHTGIVVGVDDKYIYTIEGNTGDAVRERKYEIGSSAYGKISGWIRMNEWTGGSSDIPRDTYLANNNSEDANEKDRSTL